MELVKTILIIELDEAIHPWLEIRSLLREAGEKPQTEIQGTPITIELPEKKQLVEMNVRALALMQEDISSLEENIDIIYNKIERINEASKIPKIKKMAFDSYFIEPFAMPFHEILLLIKKHFLRENNVVGPYTDVAIIFDQRNGDLLKHTHFGPMDKEQLTKQYLKWSRKAIPENFVFISNKYEINKVMGYQSTIFKSLLIDASEWQRVTADKLFKYLKQEAI